jgi:hypothetical protein
MVRFSIPRLYIKDVNDDVAFIPNVIGMHKFIGAILGWDDMNDGFARTHCSRNKYNNARIHKIKPSKMDGFRSTVRTFDYNA